MSYVSRAKEAITLANRAEQLSDLPGGEWWRPNEETVLNEENKLIANVSSPEYTAFIAESKTLIREMAAAIKLIVHNPDSYYYGKPRVTIHKSKGPVGLRRSTICKQIGSDIAVAEKWPDVTCKKCWNKVDFVEKE